MIKPADTPLGQFISANFEKFDQDLETNNFMEAELLLYVMYSLDNLKDKDIWESYADSISDKIRVSAKNYFKQRNILLNKGDLGTVTDLSCAFTLYCIGLLLDVSWHYKNLYSRLLNGFGTYKENVLKLKGKINACDFDASLKSWLQQYMVSEDYYTYSGACQWDEETSGETLPVNLGQQQGSVVYQTFNGPTNLCVADKVGEVKK